MINKVKQGHSVDGRSWRNGHPAGPTQSQYPHEGQGSVPPVSHLFPLVPIISENTWRDRRGTVKQEVLKLYFICFMIDLPPYKSFLHGSFSGIALPESLSSLFHVFHTPAHCSICHSHSSSSLDMPAVMGRDITPCGVFPILLSNHTPWNIIILSLYVYMQGS